MMSSSQNFCWFIFILLLPVLLSGQNHVRKIPDPEVQIKMAVIPAPKDKKDNAKVYGYDQNGKFVVLREGSNDMICLASDPSAEKLHVACYFSELEPFMARGRDLIGEGITGKERDKIRGEEIESGKLPMPRGISTLFVYDAEESDFDPNTGEVSKGRLRSVLYVPFLTGEESGLPTSPAGPGIPWLMDAGTHKAHIMITPAKP